MTDAIVTGGSRGIGAAIVKSLESIECRVVSTSRARLDTSDMASVRNFASAHPETDILVLNTGGPPPKEFEDIEENEWLKYHNQLFLGFCILLKRIHVRDGGYIFAISSTVIREPESNLIISGAYRSAFASVFKILSRKMASRDISCINIAPGPTNTDRMRELVGDTDAFAARLPMGRLGEPSEIGEFVKSIISGKIKYLSGITIPFDGARSAYTF